MKSKLPRNEGNEINERKYENYRRCLDEERNKKQNKNEREKHILRPHIEPHTCACVGRGKKLSQRRHNIQYEMKKQENVEKKRVSAYKKKYRSLILYIFMKMILCTLIHAAI